MKRAAIYIRVSSERQGEKKSPEEQELNCLEYCKKNGYKVVEIYRDISKYRSGNRLIEPTATRSDRPGFRRMMADADSGHFEIIVAWRQDRLYRGINRATLDINERVKKKIVRVELSNDYYDPSTAEVKAWAAGVELEAKHERLMMGVTARLKEGKAWNGGTPYGYDCIDGDYIINGDEAIWVKRIWEWFSEGVSGRDIRFRLIAGEAPQRRDVKYPWAIQRIYQMVKKDYYHAGVITRKWDGKTYEIPIPPIIDSDTVKRVKERLANWKKYPAGNLKSKALAAGLIYCKSCGCRMILKHTKQCIYYQCRNMGDYGEKFDGCASTRSLKLIDGELWEKVWSFISKPNNFEAAIEERIKQLQASEDDVIEKRQKLEQQIEELLLERQKIITWARKNIISEDDLNTQLVFLTNEDTSLRRELASSQLLITSHTDKLLEVARIYRERVKAGLEAINAEPETDNQAELQFEFRKKIVQGIVTRVDVNADKSIEVYTEFDFGENISLIPASWRSVESALRPRDWLAFSQSFVL